MPMLPDALAKGADGVLSELQPPMAVAELA